MNSRLFVAIVGGSGSGKTWLANKLQSRLRGTVARLSLDDFYRDRSYLSLHQRARVNFDSPRAIDWPEFRRVLDDCCRGKRTRIPRYDFKTHTRTGSRPFVPKPIILVEGLWLLNSPSLRSLFHCRLFLECSRRTRLQRRVRRDQSARGRSLASIRRQFALNVDPMHTKHVRPQRRQANLVFTGVVTARQVHRLAKKLVRRLASL